MLHFLVKPSEHFLSPTPNFLLVLFPISVSLSVSLHWSGLVFCVVISWETHHRWCAVYCRRLWPDTHKPQIMLWCGLCGIVAKAQDVLRICCRVTILSTQYVTFTMWPNVTIVQKCWRKWKDYFKLGYCVHCVITVLYKHQTTSNWFWKFWLETCHIVAI